MVIVENRNGDRHEKYLLMKEKDENIKTIV